MDPILIERWMEGSKPLPILDEASVGVAREEARELAARLGFGSAESGALPIVVSELAHNQLRHGRQGLISLIEIERGGVRGVEVIAADGGPGIVDPRGAFEGGGSSSRGLGVGLSGVLRLSDEVDVDIRLGEGTCIRARKFAQRASRRREVAVLGRPYPDERTNGDDATFVRSEGGLLLAVADGLGHGPEAFEASCAAIAAVRAEAKGSPSAMVKAADAAVAGTRGAVLTVVSIDEEHQAYEAAAVGNVSFHAVSAKQLRTFVGSAFVLRGGGARVAIESDVLGPHDVAVLVSDGITSRARVEPEILRKHPIFVAHHVMERHARHNDDVMVVVAM